jgi:hypothetical protein
MQLWLHSNVLYITVQYPVQCHLSCFLTCCGRAATIWARVNYVVYASSSSYLFVRRLQLSRTSLGTPHAHSIKAHRPGRDKTYAGVVAPFCLVRFPYPPRAPDSRARQPADAIDAVLSVGNIRYEVYRVPLAQKSPLLKSGPQEAQSLCGRLPAWKERHSVQDLSVQFLGLSQWAVLPGYVLQTWFSMIPAVVLLYVQSALAQR